MDGEENNVKSIVKGSLKSSLKNATIVVIIVVAILGLIPIMYTVLKDDIDKLSDKTETYTTKVNSQGQVVYVKSTTKYSKPTVEKR